MTNELFDKRDNCCFHIANFAFMSNNYSICTHYCNFCPGMLNNDLDLDDQLERVQDDLAANELKSDENLQGALEESETDNAEDAAVEVQDSTCCSKTNTCILYVIACAQDKNSY